MNKPHILLTNDDGIDSRGIIFFAEMLSNYGKVTVVAPSTVQSGMSVSINLHTPLHLDHRGEKDGIDWWAFSGTPVSCVKAAVNEVFSPDNLPDFVFSGINIGSNYSVAALYSGTLGACAEGTLYDMPSIGFSLCTHLTDCDFSGVREWGKFILDEIFSPSFSMKKGTYLNVNFPYLPTEQIKGIRMARRGLGRWVREFERRTDETNGEHFWMNGVFEDLETEDRHGDHTTVHDGFISVVPLKTDATDTDEIQRLKSVFNR